MKYLIPSIGRSGSTLISELIRKSLNEELHFAAQEDDLIVSKGRVIKTHRPLDVDLPYEYRAVFLYDRPEYVVASLYRLAVLKHWRKKSLDNHLSYLGVRYFHRYIFSVVFKVSQTLAFIYLVRGDKFKFKNNINSWKKSKQVIFICYSSLENATTQTLECLEKFLGFSLSKVVVRKRLSQFEKLPVLLKKALHKQYKNFQIACTN